MLADLARLGRSRALPALAAFACLVLQCQACQPRGSPGQVTKADRTARRNLVLVVADALRASSLRLYGYPRENAPHLSALAGESIVLERHLANYPGTPISVSQMQTGRLMPPLLMSYAYALAPVRAPRPDVLILPQALRKAGYRTGIVTSHPWFEDAPLLEHFETKALVAPAAGEVYAPFEAIAPQVLAYLAERRRDGEPFFLYVHAMDTHAPRVRHRGFDRFLSENDWPPLLNSYDSAILYTDHWVNQVVSALRAQSLLERTVFVFTSDHGEEFAEAGNHWWDRRHGATLRRAQVHVPLLVRLPGDPVRSRRVAGLTRHIDLAPTLLRLAMPDAPLERYRLDGSDLSEALDSGGPVVGAPSSLAYSWRYWGLHQADSELIYDQWEDRTSLYRFERDAHNFPVPVSVADAQREAALGEQLRQEYQRRSREFLELPATTSHLERAVVGVPTLLFREEGSAIPTYQRDPMDHRWLQEGAMLLQCAPGESPGPFVAGMPWAPGRYRVGVRFADSYLKRGYLNRFRIQFLGYANGPVTVDGGKARSTAYDLGVQEIGDMLKLRISDPVGGVAISGFELALEGSPAAGAWSVAEEERRERLRALGYVR